MNEADRRKLETMTWKAGFSGFSDPTLLPVLGGMIINHMMLAALLNTCSAQERQTMLDSIRPHLKFPAYATVYDYERMMGDKIEAEENAFDRYKIGDQEFEETLKELASHVVIKVKCHKCPREAQFVGSTPFGGIIRARQAGWVRNKSVNKEVCPKCPCDDRGKRRRCPGCSRRHYPPDCRVISAVEGSATTEPSKPGETIERLKKYRVN